MSIKPGTTINGLKFQCAGEHRVTEEPTTWELKADDSWAYVPGERIRFCVLPMGHGGDHMDSKGRRWKRLLIAKVSHGRRTMEIVTR